MKPSIIACYIYLVYLSTGCATNRKSQFNNFATAGTSYANAIIALTEEAGKIAIDADSELLIKTMNELDHAGRKTALQEHTQELQGLISSLVALRSHSSLLKKYFSTLEKLANSEAPAIIAQNTGELVQKLSELGSSLSNTQIGDAPVKSFLSKSANLAISHFEQKALENELRKHAKAIHRELDIQQAFLGALTEDIQADMNTIRKAKSWTQVAVPYLRGGKLPKEWREIRKQLISSVAMNGSIANAQLAAKSMQEKFRALTENRITSADFGDLFTDINAMFELVELAQQTIGEK